jgi:glycosyltransferase involved in cell wall biosynthesis
VRIVQLNLAAARAIEDPERLLASYHTLTGWSDALTGAGARVHVVQRFPIDATINRGGVTYEFVADGGAGTPAPWAVFPQVARAVRRATPDVIHINGLIFPGMVRALHGETEPQVVIVLQDHSGTLPRALPAPLNASRRIRWQRALRHADACTFTARELAERWHALGLPRTVRVLEIPEASTSLQPLSRDDARTTTAIAGAPSLLWVGRLDRNKDPLTILAGLERALLDLPDARVTMIAPGGVLQDQVRTRIVTSPVLRGRVTMIGRVAHAEMNAYYSSADIFVSASHHEGSGYALIEAMACGVVTCVTDIPAFRALTGGCGTRWPVGDADAFSRALCELARRDLTVERAAVRRRFEEALSWPVIGRQTFDAYARLIAARNTGE